MGFHELGGFEGFLGKGRQRSPKIFDPLFFSSPALSKISQGARKPSGLFGNGPLRPLEHPLKNGFMLWMSQR
jgi:hypothetical protein